MEEALENLCERILDYSVHAERKGSLRYAKVRRFLGRALLLFVSSPPKALHVPLCVHVCAHGHVEKPETDSFGHLSPGAIHFVLFFRNYFMCEMCHNTLLRSEDSLWELGLSTMWVLWIEFRSLGLVGDTFTHEDILPYPTCLLFFFRDRASLLNTLGRLGTHRPGWP